jgi:hypothetical protein
MRNYSDDMYKTKGYDDNYYNCSPMDSFVPLIDSNEQEVVTTSSVRRDYPGNRRIPMSSSDMANPPPGTVLIRTAGNALQAIPATILEEKQQPSSQLIEVQVPPNTRPGDTIHVRSPYTGMNEEEMLIAATIPDGVYPGQTFYVQCPTNSTTASNTVELTSVAVLATNEEEQTQRGWW